mgnify:CR=1 FL=1
MNHVVSTRPIIRSPRSRARRAGRPLLLSYLLIVGSYALLFAFWQAEPVPGTAYVLAITLFAVCLFPIVRWYARGAIGVPVFEVIVLSYAVQFSMPVFTQPNVIIIFSQPFYIRWALIESVLLLAILGVVALIGGYGLARRLPFMAHIPKIDLPLNDAGKRQVFIIGAIVVGNTITLAQAMGWLTAGAAGAIFSLLSRQMQVALILLAYSHFRQERVVPAQTLLLYGALAISFITGLLTGLLENALLPLVSLTLVFWHTRRRLPWHWLAIGITLYLVLNPAKFTYRRLVWYGATPTTAVERVSLWGDLASESAANLLDRSSSETVLSSTLARFDLVHKFAYVYHLTPDYISYYNGQTYNYFIYAWIPRLVWPDKPAVSANEQIDVDYMLKQSDSGTSIGIGQLPEAYINFGLIGIVMVMAIQGFIFALLDSSLNGSRSDGGRAIYLSVMVYFLNGIGSAAAVLFGALFQQILANALILRLFATGWRRHDDVKTQQS